MYEVFDTHDTKMITEIKIKIVKVSTYITEYRSNDLINYARHTSVSV